MTLTLNETTELAQALHQIRKARHHRDCYCRNFKRQFCTPAEEIWTNTLNRLLESAR